MLASLIIVFREVLEAGLVIGIAFAVSRGLPDRLFWIGGGAAAGLIGACLVAASLGTLAQSLNGVGPEVLNSAVLGTAAGMLLWHKTWMPQHGRETAAGIKMAGVEARNLGRGLAGLGVVVAMAVLREGSEVVLFLVGLSAAAESALSMVVGSAVGLALGAVAGGAAYLGLL